MKFFSKKIINKVFINLGYEIKKVANNDLRKTVDSPLSARYFLPQCTFWIDLPLEKARLGRWFTCHSDSLNPFIVAAQSLQNNQSSNAILETLRDFSNSVEIKNAKEALGLENASYFHPLTKLHPYAAVFPWHSQSPEERLAAELKSASEENKLFRLDSSESLWFHASTRKVEIEAERLHRTLSSINDKGFLFDKTNHIGAFIIAKGNDWRWAVSGGQHRVAALAVLNYTHCPVLVKSIIRREEVSNWPHVKSGLYSEKEALQVFDRFFEASPPPAFNDWRKKVREMNDL